MNKIKLIVIALIAVFGLTNCEGDKGEPGVNILGNTAEFTVNFNDSNEFTYLFSDNNIEVLESDAVLVYRSEQSISDPTGPIDVWKLLPETIYFDNGDILTYSFDHTFRDVRIFIDGNFDLSTLTPEYYQNQLFRVVVVPSDFANNPNNDLQTYESLMQEASKKGFQIDRKL
ncbi:hypothetical protein [Mesonia aestuariivivens]|uniref:Collagen-like protein n=1 Tax=Mesonia aestuariivivens TaxID=2796128 RepID=A0ABS6W0Z6_9FLAO|nr:hypothetical protein [Mesonia aestuariivivens]MBW2961217.1 hypothetical protein [Mesonia aestuariivivens]